MSIPHVAIIMDGNGRWAARRGRPRWTGHVKGAQVVRDVVAHCARQGVGQLTLYAFSSDNWKRPETEVRTLFELFTTHLHRQLASLKRNGIRLSVIGRRDRLPVELLQAIALGERKTAGGRRMHLRVAIDYSSRVAMAQSLGVAPAPLLAAAAPAARSATGSAAESAAPASVPAADAGSILPPVDLLIRTGGERRLSDFLLWECAYAELAFLDVAFPDLTRSHLDAVFADYAARERRFGGVQLQEGA